jgi:hypothetical protein
MLEQLHTRLPPLTNKLANSIVGETHRAAALKCFLFCCFFFGGERLYTHKAMQRQTLICQRDVPGQDADRAQGNSSIFQGRT